ncbi:MAG TPA: NAD(P)/FAD-dependent oxidoreductase [Candidatus Eisenbacteria bacterium]
MSPEYDVIIVGAGTAGLSAALILGRARRRVRLLDWGSPRNAPARTSNGVFTRDGTPPDELARLACAQLAPYETVSVTRVPALGARELDGGFEVNLEGGQVITCRKLLLAHGVVDEMPAIPGVPELWGSAVFHCPYCDGWEVRDQPLAFHPNGDGEAALNMARLLLCWSRDLVLCTNGQTLLSKDDRRMLERWGVGVREEPMVRIEACDTEAAQIVFQGGGALARRALVLHPHQHLACDMALTLGCTLDDKGLLSVDPRGETAVPGVYAAGDIITGIQMVIRAAASGATAAVGINNALALDV